MLARNIQKIVCKCECEYDCTVCISPVIKLMTVTQCDPASIDNGWMCDTFATLRTNHEINIIKPCKPIDLNISIQCWQNW